MTPAIALFVLGYILLRAGFKNQSPVDAALGHDTTLGSDVPTGTYTPNPDTAGQPGSHTDTGDLPHGVAGVVSSVVGGVSMYDGHQVANWIIPHLRYARDHGWQGQVTSGFRDPEQQRQACIHVCGNPNGCPGRCAPPGTSNHQGKRWPKGAVDVTDYEAFGRIVAHSPHPGRLINNLPEDRVHFSQSGG